MAATGKTPILLYGSTTPTNAPTAGNLTNSSDGCEIAINVADKNLFFKDSSNNVNTVPIRQSSASSNGWLSSTDWSTFNSKQPAGTYVTSVTGTAPVVSSGGTTPAISMAAATGSVNGYLTSTDWTTFNSKSPAAGSSSITTVGTITSGTWNGSTIDVSHGGTGLTSLTANYVPYGNGTSAFGSSAQFKFDGTNLSVGTTGSTSNNIYLGNGSSTSVSALIINGGTTSATGPQIKAQGGGSDDWALYSMRSLVGGTAQGLGVYVSGSNPFTVWNNGTRNLSVFGSGGVSIGNTTDPGATNLSVTGTVKAVSGLFTPSTWGTSGFGAIYLGDTNNYIKSTFGGTTDFGSYNAITFVNGATPTEKLKIDTSGNIYGIAGTTAMTVGFFYIPSAAGAPSGTPAAIAGHVPMYYDTTNNKFYIYNGAWKQVALT